jgi:hypothetical protein
MPGLGAPLSSSHYNFQDSRTVVLELREYLKERITLPWGEAYFHVEDKNPSVDAHQVLEKLKTMERVKYNEINQVFTYEVRTLFELGLTFSPRSCSAPRPTCGSTSGRTHSGTTPRACGRRT